MRIAFHAVNGVGLGHLMRAVLLAREVRDLVPDAEILIVTTALDTSIAERAGFDYVQLPPRLAEPHADPSRVEVALPEPLDEAALEGALDGFAPDLVVFDTHAPLRLVSRLRETGVRTVLVLRELRAAALAEFVRKGAHLAFDRVVVPHEPDEVDMSALEGAAAEIVGPVVAPGTSVKRSRRRGRGPLVVAIVGGGGQPVDARRYLSAVADAHWLARARIADLETILVAGPYADLPPQVSLYAGLSVRGRVDDLGALFDRATVVVSQAGYNAIAEIRTHGAPAILVPGYRKSEDQRARAKRLARMGAARIARPDARSLCDSLVSVLTTPGEVERMRGAHEAHPLLPKNREAALAAMRPLARMPGPVRRVLLVAHDFAPRLGGMETVALGLARTLLAANVDVRVLTTERLGAREASGLPDGVVRPVFPLLPGARRIDLEADLLTTVHEALRDPPDVIHLMNAGLAPWVPALRATVPCAVTSHVHGNDLLAPWVAHAGTPEGYARAAVVGLSAADATFCVSRFSASLALAKGVPERRIHVVENGVDVKRFAPGRRQTEIARRLGIAEGDETVLTVSRLASRKGHRTVLRAIALLSKRRPRIKWVFTGSSDAMLADLAREARAHGIQDRVVAAGFLPEEELPDLYRLADVFALVPDAPLEDDVEGFGVALLEAAASGLPVVGTRSGGVPEAIQDGVTGTLVPPSDREALASALDAWLANPDAARSAGQRGRERVVRGFSVELAMSRMVEIWTAVLAKRRLAKRHFETFDALPRIESRGALVRLAAEARLQRNAASEKRRAELMTFVRRGREVRFRATGDGACRLAPALADAHAVGIKPRVEVKLRRFLEADFTAYALPLIDSVELVHGVPHVDASTIERRVEAAGHLLSRARAVRLFLTHDARTRPDLAMSAVPETHALRRIFRAAGVLVVPPPELMRHLSETPAGGPETAMIEPTNLCNLACPTCPTGTGKIKPLPAMTLDRFDQALSQVGPQVRNLALWNYGEPLLNRALPDMIASAKKRGVGVVKVSSNVHFLDGERGTALLRSGLDVLILSVDGASQETYSMFRRDGDFARVATQVAWLTAEKRRMGLKKPRIELQFIVMRHNEHELDEMRSLARQWQVDKLRIKTVGAEDAETKHLIPSSRLLSRYDATGEAPNTVHAFCSMAWDHTVINVDGAVTPCCYLRPDMGDAFVMGNVFETSFQEIWRGPRYRAFRARMLDGRATMPVCGRCRGGTHDLLAAVEEVGPS